jgi:hypothetical protein
MLLEHGRIVAHGDPVDVGARYLELNFEHQRGRAAEEGPSQVATVAQAWIEVDGRGVDSVHHGTPFTIHALVDVREPIERPELHVRLTTDDGAAVFGTTTRGVDSAGERLEPRERVHLRVRLENPLGAGRYYVDVGVHAAGGGMLAYHGRACDFMVHGSPEDSGLVTIPHTVELDRARPRAEVEAPR